MASGSLSGSIIIHSTSSNKVEYRVDNVFAYGIGVKGLCYLLNGSLVACGYDEGPFLKVLSPSLELVQTLEGHDHDCAVLCVTVSPSGSHFATGGKGVSLVDALHQVSIGYVPKFDGSIPTSGAKELAVGREREGPDPVGVALQRVR